MVVRAQHTAVENIDDGRADTGLKEKEEAFHWLEKAHQERSAMLAFVKMDPRLDYLMKM